jgi:hypothetical protein
VLPRIRGGRGGVPTTIYQHATRVRDYAIASALDELIEDARNKIGA